MAKIDITIHRKKKREGLRPADQRGPLLRRSEAEYLPRRLKKPECHWGRSWDYEFDSYRVFTTGGLHPLTYNGTKFSNITADFDHSAFGEPFGFTPGLAGGSVFSPTTFLEPFDPNALPLVGNISCEVDRFTGVCMVTTPHGSFTINGTSDPPFWVGNGQFANWGLGYGVFQSGSPSIAHFQCDASIDWNHYHNSVWKPYDGPPFYGQPFAVHRDINVYTVDGIHIIQANSQLQDHLTGTYIPPEGSGCDTADTEAELFRQSVDAQLNARPFLRNIVWSPMEII